MSVVRLPYEIDGEGRVTVDVSGVLRTMMGMKRL
jgi:hypothetical protein